MSRRAVLVTGSSGLLGHAVLAAASQRWLCVGFDAVPANDPVSDAQYVYGDLRDPLRLLQTMRDYQISDVVHAGAISHPLLLADQPAMVYAINVGGTLNVLEAARLSAVGAVVLVSSGAVYGSALNESPIRELSPLLPDSIYGATKAAAEMLVQGYARRFGLSSVILRPVSIYGLRRRTFALPNYLLARALEGLSSQVHGGDEPIDLVHVEDASRAIIQALDSRPEVGAAFNVATGVQHTYAEIARLVQELVPGSQINVTPGLISPAPEARTSIANAERDLHFRAEISLEQGLARLKKEFESRPDLRRAAATAAGLAGSIVDQAAGRAT